MVHLISINECYMFRLVCPGTVFRAEIIKSTAANQHGGDVGSVVAIKRTDKSLFEDNLTVDPNLEEEDASTSMEDTFLVVDEVHSFSLYVHSDLQRWISSLFVHPIRPLECMHLERG